jgi:glycosyltransferase involved in cell wall biosynthesis
VISEQEKAAFYHTCEVTVLPSINSTESYGMVQVESLACGAPVVASDRPGVRVPVLRTGMGRIVPPADPGALAAAILEVLDAPERFRGDPEPLLRLSTPEAVAQEYESLFQALLDKDLAKALRARLTDC